jgi:hypothetical protein|tara:strand:- start:15 stop:227 length:213 start_codon:yes stop_codon:yes gene_type:complete
MTTKYDECFEGIFTPQSVIGFKMDVPQGDYVITLGDENVTVPRDRLRLTIKQMGWEGQRGVIKGPLENKI